MEARKLFRFFLKGSAIAAITGSLLLIPSTVSAETRTAVTSKPLDLSLPDIYTNPPIEGGTDTLSFAVNPYQGSLSGIKTTKNYTLGLKRVKVDKSMRVRGWEMQDNLYLGQTSIGKEWGVGLIKTQGNFAYGLNNKGVGMIYNADNAVYRVNLQEISLEIGF